MGPASSRENEYDAAAADNGLAIAIPVKIPDSQEEQGQPPEEAVSNILLKDIKTHFLLHRRHITSPLQSPAG
jgi:hypothetical protein